jgi:large subunit ribosomal protein L17
MRHRKDGKKLSRTSSHRWAMYRNMVTSLFEHEKIQTTDAKAKELRRLAEKMVTLAKRGDLHARRLANAVIRNKIVARKLFNELALRYNDRQGGYLRIVKVGYRSGDNAPISVVELLPADDEKMKKKKVVKTKTSKPEASSKEAPPRQTDQP